MRNNKLNRTRDRSREDYLANRVMAVFTAAILMLLGLTYLWNAYDVGRTFFLARRVNDILIGVAAVGLLASVVWLSSDIRKGRLRGTILNGGMATLFFAVLLGSLLLVRYSPEIARRVLYVVIPGVAILHLIYCSYQREFFDLCVTHSAVIFGLWVIAHTANDRLALLAAVGCIAVCGVAVLLFLAAARRGGTLKLGRAHLRLLDDPHLPHRAVYIVYGLTAVAAAAAYIVGAPASYYIMYAAAAFLVVEAVFFTVKLI